MIVDAAAVISGPLVENAARTALTNVAGQAMLALNSTDSQFVMHPSTIAASGLPMTACFGFVLRLIIGFKRG